MENVKLNTIEEAIEDFKAGNFVIVVVMMRTVRMRVI